MRALRVHAFGQPPELRLDDLPDPEPGEGEVLVEVKAAGVNPVDTYVAAGQYALVPDLPYTPGTDAAGVVVRPAGDWQAGDRVIVAGTTQGKLRGCYATHAVCRPEMLVELPDRLDFAEGAAVNVAYVTAFRALIDHAKARRGDVVLVHGATGGVGLAAVQIAKAHGLTVYATGGSDEGRELLREQKADLVLDHHAGDHLAGLPEPPTVILEMLADVNLRRDLEAVAEGGRIVVIGSRGEATFPPRLLMMKRPIVTGMNYWDGGDAGVRRALEAVAVGLRNGDLTPIVGEEFPLAEANRAFQAVMAGGKTGKVVLVM